MNSRPPTTSSAPSELTNILASSNVHRYVLKRQRALNVADGSRKSVSRDGLRHPRLRLDPTAIGVIPNAAARTQTGRPARAAWPRRCRGWRRRRLCALHTQMQAGDCDTKAAGLSALHKKQVLWLARGLAGHPVPTVNRR